MAMQIIVILVVRVTTPPISTDGITIGMMTLLGSSSTFGVDNKALVMGVGTVSVVMVLHSPVKSVSMPGTVQLNFAKMKKD